MHILPPNPNFMTQLNSWAKSTKKVVLQKYPQILKKKLRGQSYKGGKIGENLKLAPP